MKYLNFLLLTSCKETAEKTNLLTEETVGNKISVLQTKQRLEELGFQIFDYVDEETKDTIMLQQYFITFLKRVENTSLS